MHISVFADTKSTKKSQITTKNSKINPFVVKSLLESNCKRFHKSSVREHFSLKPETELEILIPPNDAFFFTNTAEMNGSCIQFPSFMS